MSRCACGRAILKSSKPQRRRCGVCQRLGRVLKPPSPLPHKVPCACGRADRVRTASACRLCYFDARRRRADFTEAQIQARWERAVWLKNPRKALGKVAA